MTQDRDKRVERYTEIILTYIEEQGLCSQMSADEIKDNVLLMISDFEQLSMELVSENPVEDALKEMKIGVPDRYEAELYKALKNCKGKLNRVFKSARESSNAVEVVKPVIKRRATRPMELVYRPVCREMGDVYAREASMRFRDVKDNTLTYEEVKHIIAKLELSEELGQYFFLEVCDTVRRFDACHIQNQWIGLEVLPAFYNRRRLKDQILPMIEATEVDPAKIRLMVSAAGLKKATKTFAENVKNCKKIGIGFILTDVTREFLEQTTMTWEEFPLAGIRFTSECLMDAGMQEHEKFLHWQNAGVEILVDGIEDKRVLYEVLENVSASYTGIFAGIYEREDDIVKRALKLGSI